MRRSYAKDKPIRRSEETQAWWPMFQMRIRIDFGRLDPDPHCFSRSLDVLYGGLRISRLNFSYKKDINFYSDTIVQILIIKTLDPDPVLDSDPLEPKRWLRIRLYPDIWGHWKNYVVNGNK